MLCGILKRFCISSRRAVSPRGAHKWRWSWMKKPIRVAFDSTHSCVYWYCAVWCIRGLPGCLPAWGIKTPSISGAAVNTLHCIIVHYTTLHSVIVHNTTTFDKFQQELATNTWWEDLPSRKLVNKSPINWLKTKLELHLKCSREKETPQ